MYLRGRYYDPEISHFINVDPMRDGLNWYGYAGGNPVKYHDPSGYAWETILDVVGLVSSIYDMVTEPSWKNAAFLVWDVASIILPFVPGSYVAKGGKILKAVSKVASKVDDAIDLTKKALKIGKKSVDVADAVIDVVKAAPKVNVLGKVVKTLDTAMDVKDIVEYTQAAFEGISGADGELSPSNYPNPDPSMDQPPVRYEPQTIEEIERMRQGKGPKTKATHGTENIEAHHRGQIPVENGGILDELQQGTHRGQGNHTRHGEPSQLTPAQRAKEIREHWKKRGGEYFLPSEGI